MPEPIVNEGKSDVVEIQPDSSGKYPEVVPWNQYVGIKQSLGKKLDTANARVTSLEEQLKTAVKPEDHKKIADELASIKAAHETTTKELQAIKESTATEKRKVLVDRGIPEEKVKSMSIAELTTAVEMVGFIKPKADLGSGGGGAGALVGSPMELARQAYSKSK